MRNNSRFIKLILILSCCLLFSMSTACNKEPIKIGMVGSLTSKQSQLAIDARNAIELGVDEINRTGGINGSTIELVVKDDYGTEEEALKRHQEFIDEGINLVIGHMTSSMADAVLASQSEDLLFISPSMSVSRLSDLDDYFIRTCPINNYQGDSFLSYIIPNQFEHITVIYDNMNRDYTETLANRIKVLSMDSQNMEVQLIAFDSRENDLNDSIEKINLDNTECIMMISQSTDTAYISQKIRRQNKDVMLFSVSWSMTQDLIYQGGYAVEGMYFVGAYQAKEQSDEFKIFKEKFEERYSYQPSFISILAYDALNVLVEGIENAENIDPETVKKSILSIEEFQGLEESFKINSKGDSNRSYLIYQLQDESFIPQYD